MSILPTLVALFQFTTSVVQLADSTMPAQLADAWRHRSQAAELCITGHLIRRHAEPGRLIVTQFIPIQVSDSACTQERYIGAVHLMAVDSTYIDVMVTYGRIMLEMHRQWYLVMFVYGVLESGHPKIVVVSY
jgi:hypothetical protein